MEDEGLGTVRREGRPPERKAGEEGVAAQRVMEASASHRIILSRYGMD